MFPKFMAPPNNNGYRIVIAGQALSLRATTRNPVVARQWIPDQVRDDSH
jgi:hypothetical protein